MFWFFEFKGRGPPLFMRSYGVFVFLFLILFSDRALAWECTAHIGLTMTLSVPGTRGGEFKDPYAFCTQYHANRALRRKHRRPISGCDETDRYRDLVYASQDPDEKGKPRFGDPGRNFFLGFSHLYEADKRALDALRAAIAEYHSNRICSGEGAFSHLGRSLHYLQDWGDPSKDIDSIWFARSRNNRKAGFRLLAARLVSELLFYGDFPGHLKPSPQIVHDIQSRFANLQNPREILQTLDGLKQHYATSARQRYHEIRAGEQSEEYRAYFDRRMADIAVLSIVSIRAAQARWIDYWTHMIIQAPRPPTPPQPDQRSCLQYLPNSRDEKAWCALGQCLAGQRTNAQADTNYAMQQASKFWMEYALKKGLARRACGP